MYSVALSSVQSDYSSGDHSVFVTELLKNVGVPNLTAEEALNRTRLAVSAATHGDRYLGSHPHLPRTSPLLRVQKRRANQSRPAPGRSGPCPPMPTAPRAYARYRASDRSPPQVSLPVYFSSCAQLPRHRSSAIGHRSRPAPAWRGIARGRAC